MKKALKIGLLGVIAGILLCSPINAAAQDPVKIGVLVPLSGIVAQGGAEMKMGIQMCRRRKKDSPWTSH